MLQYLSLSMGAQKQNQWMRFSGEEMAKKVRFDHCIISLMPIFHLVEYEKQWQENGSGPLAQKWV